MTRMLWIFAIVILIIRVIRVPLILRNKQSDHFIVIETQRR